MKKSSVIISLCSIMLSGCVNNESNNTNINLASGYQLYERNCSNCHQIDGSGLAQLYPPLLQADYIKNNPEQLDSIIKYGQHGPITVNGIQYNMPMPANKKLSDFEIKQITAYVLISFNQLDSLAFTK
ncbi:MAG: cytochrome c [Bacteroidota bacterium]